MARNLSILFFIALIFQTNLSAQDDSYFFVFLNTNPNREELPDEDVQALQTAHLQNIQRLYRDGKLPVAGPFEGGGGLFIFRTGSMEETHELLQSDPAVKAGRFKLEVYPFEQYYGSICDPGKAYEMVFRKFVRFTRPGVSTAKVHDTHKLLEKAFEEFNSLDNKKVTAGNFGGINEGIWIIEGESGPIKEFIENTKIFDKSEIAFDMKTLWIADGIFCEP